MRNLNQMELGSISGGHSSLEKPLLQSNFKDVVTMFGVWTGFNIGVSCCPAIHCFDACPPVGKIVCGVGGAVVGGFVAAIVANCILPCAIDLADCC